MKASYCSNSTSMFTYQGEKKSMTEDTQYLYCSINIFESISNSPWNLCTSSPKFSTSQLQTWSTDQVSMAVSCKYTCRQKRILQFLFWLLFFCLILAISSLSLSFADSLRLSILSFFKIIVFLIHIWKLLIKQIPVLNETSLNLCLSLIFQISSPSPTFSTGILRFTNRQLETYSGTQSCTINTQFSSIKKRKGCKFTTTRLSGSAWHLQKGWAGRKGGRMGRIWDKAWQRYLVNPDWINPLQPQPQESL